MNKRKQNQKLEELRKHKQVDIGTWRVCDACSDWKNIFDWDSLVKYPCDARKAIEKELGASD